MFLTVFFFILGKAFDITYVRLKFYTSRPESFAIYKRMSVESEWIPYQYYSATCMLTYGVRNTNFVTYFNETKALCTSEYSDISPLTGGNVAFSTLEGRPSAYNFEDSPQMQVRLYYLWRVFFFIYSTPYVILEILTQNMTPRRYFYGRLSRIHVSKNQ